MSKHIGITSLPSCPVANCWTGVPHWHVGSALPGHPDRERNWSEVSFGYHTRTYAPSKRAAQRIAEIRARTDLGYEVPNYGTLEETGRELRPATPEEWAWSVAGGTPHGRVVSGGDFETWRIYGGCETFRVVIRHRPTGGIAVVYHRDNRDACEGGDYAPGVLEYISREHKYPREWVEVYLTALGLASQDVCLFSLEEALHNN